MEVVCLASGGIDSTILLFRLKRIGFSLRPLFINYGQKAHRMERNSLRKICEKLNLSLDEIDISGIGKLYSGLTHPEISPITDPYFPGRNLLLLTIACSFAASRNIEVVTLGIVSRTTFSDQTEGFIRSSKLAIGAAFGSRIEIFAPLLKLDKLEIVRMAKKYSIPYQDTYSCYVGKKEPCGECLGCKDRNSVLKVANL